MRTASVFGRQAQITLEGTTVRGAAGRRLIAEGARLSGQAEETVRRISRTGVVQRQVIRQRVQIPRLMPEQIYRDATSREDAIRLLRRFGYLRAEVPVRAAVGVAGPAAAEAAQVVTRLGTPALRIPRASVSPEAVARRFDTAAKDIDAFYSAPHVSGVLGRVAADRATLFRSRDRFRTERAVGAYTGRDSAYVDINRALRQARGGPLGPEVAEEIRQQVEDLDRMLRYAPLPGDTVLYRGVQNPRAAVPGWGDDVVGLEWTARGYQSTSALVDVAEQFARGEVAGAGTAVEPMVMRLLAPKGTPGVQLSPTAAEVLLPHGLRYRIVADHGVVGGVRRIDVEVIPARLAAAPAPARAVVAAEPGLPTAQRLSVATGTELEASAKRVYEGAFAGIRTTVTGARHLDEGIVSVRGELFDPTGRKVGDFSRLLVRVDDDSLVAYHDALEIDPRIQGQGFAQAFNSHLERWYRTSGIDRVELYANIDVGGYAWARSGYNFAHLRAAERVMHRLRTRLDHGRLDEQGTLIPTADVDAARELLDRAERLPFGSAGYPTAYEVSQLGRLPGAGRDDMWIGKRVLLGSAWDAVKPL